MRCLVWAACGVVAALAVTISAGAQIHGAGNALTGSQRPPLASPQAMYTLHPGDTLAVSFRYTPEFNDEVVIGPDGRAALKSAGDIELAGLTLPEAEHEIVLDSSDKLVSPEVTVQLKDFDRPHVFVAGEVANPGREDLRKVTTAIQAIMAAGGPKEDGAMGRVLLFRKINSEVSEVHVLKLSRYDKKTRLKNDMVLEPDDVLLVGHDHLASVGRFIKTIDLGVYLQPLSAQPVY